jgi:hypothetical protein
MLVDTGLVPPAAPRDPRDAGAIRRQRQKEKQRVNRRDPSGEQRTHKDSQDTATDKISRYA